MFDVRQRVDRSKDIIKPPRVMSSESKPIYSEITEMTAGIRLVSIHGADVCWNKSCIQLYTCKAVEVRRLR